MGGNCHKNEHRHFNRKRLVYAIAITFITLILEIVGGIYSNSLALLSDAAHMFSHLFALSVSYAAIILALRPANERKTYGYYRAEILAAFINGLSLFLITFAILYGAYERFKNPIDIRSTEMFIVAAIGLFVNIATAFLLHTGSREDINIKGAFFHALGDLISSVGVVVAAVIIHYSDLYILDTIVSILIALVIIYWAIKLVIDSAHILLEGIPKEIDLDKVINVIKKIVGQPINVHHVHAWQISTNIYAFTAHIMIKDIDQHVATELQRKIAHKLEEEFSIEHTTIQFQCESCQTSSSNCTNTNNE